MKIILLFGFLQTSVKLLRYFRLQFSGKNTYFSHMYHASISHQNSQGVQSLVERLVSSTPELTVSSCPDSQKSLHKGRNFLTNFLH